MATNSSWVPNEDPQTLFSERCWLQGVFVSTLAYGINVCLYFTTLHYLVRSQIRMQLKRSLPLAMYITLLFSLATVFMVSLAGFTQMTFIDDRNYPGGPNAFENDEFSIPLDNAGNIAFVVANWLCDALMVWRFKVIFQTSRGFPIWIVISLPCLMLACSVALGTLFLLQVSATNVYLTHGINFTLPYLSVSLGLNVLLTVSIVARLLSFRQRIASLLGPNYGKQYTSMAAMIVESIAPYSAMSLAFLVLFGLGNAVSQVFLQSLSQIQVRFIWQGYAVLTFWLKTISALLIVFRIAQGKGWTTETANGGMRMQSEVQSIASITRLETTKDDELRDGLRISGDVFAKGPIV